MRERLSKGAVLVTGASTGIGRTISLTLAAVGFQVFAGVRKEEEGKSLAEQERHITPVILDVTNGESIKAAVATIEQAVGKRGLAGLVNNAGIAVGGPLEFVPLEQLRQQLEVNVIGPVAVMQACLPLLRQAKGRIVNISSVSGRNSSPLLGPYAASKFALEALSDSLRVELLSAGIQVAIVEPGPIATPIWDKSLANASVLQQAGSAAITLYGPLMTGVSRYVEMSGKNADPPSLVAKAVLHALTATRPKVRYLVGRNVRVGMLLKLLPTRLHDRLLDSFLRRLGKQAQG